MKTNRPLGFRNVLAFLFLLSALSLNIFSQPQYYNFNTTAGANVFPFAVSTGKEVQLLYLAGDFASPTPAPSGNITKIYIMMTATASSTFTNMVIKMGQASGLTTFGTGVWYTGQLDTVYYRASVSMSSTASQWMAITLDRPFSYDPTKSLIVDINQCVSTTATMNCATTALANFRRNTSLVNTSCPFVWGQQSGTLSNFGIDVAPPSCSYTWGTQTSGTANLLQAVWAPSANVCWIAGAAATVRKTTNGGTTWVDGNPNPGVITGDIYNIWALDANTALLTTSPAATFIYRTTNGGANWTQVFTQAGGFIDAIVMTNATTGYAYGDPVSSRWSLWKTIDGGATWDSTGMFLPVTGSEAGWNNAMCVIGNNIWFGTNNTKVYHSTNAGLTGSWVGNVTTGNASTYGVWFTSATNGICVGTIVQTTTDGGTTWVNGGTVAGTGNMTSIGGSGSNWWLTRGNNTYGSTDFGATWTGAGFTGTQALWATSITSGPLCLTGWSVGAAGTLLKLNGAPVGVQDPISQIPNSYKLEQNYPNPFNPTTTITYSLPTAGNVILKVYDITGREVTTLVNSFTVAGIHSVPFDASSLASGIYIYKISTGDFTDSKKMVLIK